MTVAGTSGGLVLAVSLLLFSCESTTGRWPQKEQAVLDGELSDDESVVVVLGHRADVPSFCTGTLIAPRLVLTARHCVSVYTEGKYTCTLAGELDLSTRREPANAGEIGALLAPGDISVHVGQEPDLDQTMLVSRVIAPEADEICRNDIALLVMSADVPGVSASLRIGTGISRTETLRIVGYGQNEVERVERRERSGLEILGVGPSEFFEQEGQAMPRTFVIGRAACPGDSGGPAFSDATGELLGVFSLFRGSCTSSEARDFYTQVAPFEEMLREGFEAVGSKWPVGGEPEAKEQEASMDASGGVGGSASDAPVPQQEAKGGCRFGPEVRSTLPSGLILGVTALLLSFGLRRYMSDER